MSSPIGAIRVILQHQRIVVEPEVIVAFHATRIAPMLGYLNITGLRVALLLNFKKAQLEFKRVML